jgi:hypothetical protein
MAAFGLLFLFAGVAHFLFAVVLRVPAWSGCWASNGVPVSRVGDAAWSLCGVFWGLAMIVPPPALVAPWLAGVGLASFPVLIAAGLYDQRLHRRGQRRFTGSPRATGLRDRLHNMSPDGRRQSLAIVTRGLVYFRHGRTARWLGRLLSPVCASAVAGSARGWDLGLSAIVLLLGVAVASLLFVTLCSGVESSNWGTYDRRSEPIRYWLHVSIIGLAYLGLTFAGWFG